MPIALIEGRTCFYQDIGKGYPLLFGHSYLWDSNMWTPQLRHLSRQFRCIAVDLWSHGQSERLDAKSYTVEQLALDYGKLMEHLGIRQFAVVGLSVGGMWGAHLALNRPDAVSALVLMDTFVGVENPLAQQKYFKLLDILESHGQFTNPLLDQVVPLFFSPHTVSHKPYLVRDFRKALADMKKGNIPGVVALGRAIFSRKCLLDRLALIAQPSLVLVGKDDIPRPPKEAEEMGRLLPNGEVHVIDCAGHISNLEQPEQVNSLLEGFLKKALKYCHA